MKIKKIDSWLVTMKLKIPYRITYDHFDTAKNVFIRMETNTGIVGFGCCAPDEHVTGETADSIFESLNKTVFPVLKGIDPLRIILIMEKVRHLIPNQPTAWAGVDIALHDILGKVSQLPLWKILGGYRDRIKTSITIGIMPIDDTLYQAKDYIRQKFKCIKLKGGLNIEEDIEKILRIHELTGDKVSLRFDANQGYTVEESLRFIQKTRRTNLEILEQPTPRDQLDKIGIVTKHALVPIMADESLTSSRDAFKLARGGLVDMVNIKIMKVGGIAEARHANSVAYAAGLRSMIGCMDEAAIGIAAGLHFALARTNVKYADLDGHLDLIDDPSAGAVILRKGILFPTNKPGLGFNL